MTHYCSENKAVAAARISWIAFILSIVVTASAQTNVTPAGDTNGTLPTSPTGLHVISNGVPADSPDIPSLNWQPRSDWINVKSNVSPLAIGDGVADDTAALQAALNITNVGKTVYLPPGTYRITQTLAMHGPGPGSAIIGHGRDTPVYWFKLGWRRQRRGWIRPCGADHI